MLGKFSIVLGTGTELLRLPNLDMLIDYVQVGFLVISSLKSSLILPSSISRLLSESLIKADSASRSLSSCFN